MRKKIDEIQMARNSVMEAVPEMLQNRRSDQIASKEEEKKTRTEETNQKVDENIKESGQISLQESGYDHKIHLLSVIGEIEGHECLSANTKTTKYEHVLPRLAEIEDSREVDGVIVLLNTVGGDVESGLAIAEMIASLSKPTVSLVLGGSHSIGVPLAVSTNYSFIVPTGTMVIHPVRMSGTVIGAPATYDYFKQMQDRILSFVENHCYAKMNRLEEMNDEYRNADKGSGYDTRRRAGGGRGIDRPGGRN